MMERGRKNVGKRNKELVFIPLSNDGGEYERLEVV